jgi:hypothetical protein
VGELLFAVVSGEAQVEGGVEPAALLRVPALRSGWKGGVPPVGQGPALGPVMIWKAEVVVVGVPPEEGVRTALA